MTALTRLALPALTLRIRQLSGVLLLLFFALPAQAQTGRLEGNVLDANTKQALIGALVYIPNTTYNASVDVDGNFVMARVPVGEQTLTVSYLGYEEQSLAVTVTPGENAFLYIEAVPESFGLEQVTVSANLEGQQRALNQQRAADNVVNIISADLIARFPDLNVSEALQRVPGINIDRDNGEGGGVTVRGTPQNYTTIRINGEQIQDSGNSGGRTPGLTMFPVDQLG
ncbi:MAG: carboxypeptidase-like regulatory domain-containing protein, partial [Bacteroidota bacterium]